MRNFTLTLLILMLISPLYAQEWQQLNDPPFFRHHSNGFGFNGKGYIFEGVFESTGPDAVSNELWEYSPDTDTWVRLSDFPGPGRAIAIGDDWNGKYYYGFGSKGGFNGQYFNDLWVFDPVDTSFTELPACPCIGRAHPAFVAHNDKIFMGSGTSQLGDLKDWWIYDMVTQEWSRGPDIPGVIRHHPFQFAMDEFIYVGGGHAINWIRYNPADDSWSTIDGYPRGRVAGSQFSYDGKGYVLGGDDRFHNNVGPLQSFMRYDPLTDDWTELEPLPNGSRWANSSFIIDSDLYFFGGISESFPSDSSMWVFDLATIDPPVSTNEAFENGKEQVQVFPNPFQDKINLKKLDNNIQDSYSVSITNAQGMLIYQQEGFTFENEIFLEEAQSGVYFLTLRNESSVLSYKIMKE